MFPYGSRETRVEPGLSKIMMASHGGRRANDVALAADLRSAFVSAIKILGKGCI